MCLCGTEIDAFEKKVAKLQFSRQFSQDKVKSAWTSNILHIQAEVRELLHTKHIQTEKSLLKIKIDGFKQVKSLFICSLEKRLPF